MTALPHNVSAAQLLRALPPAQRKAWLDSLDRELAVELAQTPEFFLRPEQREPTLTPGDPVTGVGRVEGDYYLWALITGRGWGKTFTASHLVNKWARDRQAIGNGVIIIAGPTYGDVRHKMVEAQDGGILSTAHERFKPDWSPANGRGILTWPNGVKAVCVSGSDPDAFRGFNAARLWAEELCSWQDPEATWKEGIAPALRRGQNPKAVVTSTPIPLKFLEWLMARKRAVVTRGSTFDNPIYSGSYLEQLRDQYVEGSELWLQEIEGKIILDSPKALFKVSQIVRDRVHGLPEGVTLVRVVLAVDPGVAGDESNGGSESRREDGAECGILRVGKGSDGHYYVLEDHSTSGDPAVWPEEVAHVATHEAVDLTVGERNNGGKLVEMAVRAAVDGLRRSGELGGGSVEIPYKSIWSSHGKVTRAEPVAQLYKRGRVHHVGDRFRKLEHQMTRWWPDSGRKSPDRMDALVFAIAELAGLGQEPKGPEQVSTIEGYMG